jgi:uncharacterized membrane protein YesL
MFGNFFNQMYFGNPRKPDLKPEDIPKNGIPLFIDIFRSNFWQLISLNLLLIIFSIPIITIGPAFAGFNHVLRNYVFRKNVWLWNDFKDGTFKNLKQSLIITLINMLVAFVLINNYKIYSTMNNDFIKKSGIIITGLIGLMYLLMNIYIFPMMVTYDLKTKHIFKNAFIFSVIEFPRTLGILLICLFVLFVSIILAFIPLVLISFSLMGLIINVFDRMIFEKYIDNKNQVTGNDN